MQLTRFSDLSLRLLLYLAGRERTDKSVITARAIAKILNVPYTHLVKVVHHLGRIGLLTTTKGYGGGIRLAKPADEVRIGQVLRQTEPLVPVVNCFEPVCPLNTNCSLKGALDRAHEHFFVELDQYSLADLATDPPLQGLVQIAVPPVNLEA